MTTDIRAALEGPVDAVKYGNTSELIAAMKAARLALAEPEPEGPTTEELHQVFLDHSGYIDDERVMWSGRFCVAARAVLARWGTPNLAQVRSSLGDRPQSVQEEPTNQEIEEWAAASSVPGESLDPDSGRWERCLSSEEFCATVRAALAFWGHAPNA